MPKLGTIVLNPRTFGFISLPLSVYIALGAAAIIAVVSAYAHIQTSRLEACKAEHRAFVDKVESLGKAAKAKADATNLQNRKLKEKADAELKKLRIANADLSKRLRDDRSRRDYLPEAAPGARSPETACFGRPELERTLQQLDERVSGIIAEGDQAIVELDSVKRWAQD